jgi:hypothetical protein
MVGEEMSEGVFRIRQYDSKTRWQVESQSEPEAWYLVDLMYYHQIGRCDCFDFTYRKEPYAKLATRPSDHLRCKHIRVVREALLDSLLWSIGEHSTPTSFDEPVWEPALTKNG